MFFIIVFAVVGLIFFFWKLRRVDRKKAFYSSPLFVSSIISGCLLILSTFLVNQFEEEIIAETVTEANVDEAIQDSIKQVLSYDVGFVSLEDRLTDLKYHHQYIKEFRKKDIDLANPKQDLENWYLLKSEEDNIDSRSIGRFGLGVIKYFEKDYRTSVKWLRVNELLQRPYVNYYLGNSYAKLGAVDSARQHHWYELQHENEVTVKSAKALLTGFYKEKDYSLMMKLYDKVGPYGLFTYTLGRQVHLANGRIGGYFSWCYWSIVDHIQTLGFIAAIAIALIWMIYLIRLDVFNPNKLWYFIAMFVFGGISVIGVYIFSDFINIYFEWSLTGGFFNDLIYAILGIGVPEELVKITPLIIFSVFARKKLNEPIDYLIFAALSAVGFAFVENLLYLQEVDNGIVQGRAYFAAVGHMTFSSVVAYGMVIARFKEGIVNKNRTMVLYFFLGAALHGLYDFFLFQGLNLLFFMFFIFIVQIWIVIINNCLNNSSFFNYHIVDKLDLSRSFLTIALTSVIVLEYILIGIDKGSNDANIQLYSSLASGGVLIVFFASNLSSFNLIRGYWRDIYFSSREKRGYGTLPQHSLLTSWYFLNAVRDHNYLGFQICIRNHRYNKILVDVLPEDGVKGELIDRIILFEDGDPDPHWFIVKLENEIPFLDHNNEYVLIKMRYQGYSLKFENDLEVFFTSIDDLDVLKSHQPDKEQFVSYGWATISRVE